MSNGSNIPFQVFQDLELEPGTVEFAIRRIEPLSPAVLRSALAIHRHDFYEIAWITGGQGGIWIDLDHYRVGPNTLCFLSPGQIHAWEVAGDPAGFLLGFTHRFFTESPDDASALIKLPFFYGVGAAPVLSVNEEQTELFTQTCSQLLRESHLALLGQGAILRSYMRILLLEARRLRDTQAGVNHLEEASFALTKQFVLLVDAHYLDTSSVADYAAMLHVTTNHLVKTVKRSLGHPPGQIIRDRLLLEAKRLLRYADMPVAEIATYLNFEDPSYFSRFFREKTGLTPTEFREQA